MNIWEIGVRIMASGCVLGGSVGLGFCYKRKLSDRVRWLNEMQVFLSMLESEIEYSREPLPEICKRLSSQAPQQFREGLDRVYREYESNTGRTFEHSFREIFRGIFRDTVPEKEDQEVFLSFLCGSAFDDHLLLERIRDSKARLRNREETVEKEMGEKSRVAISVSAGLGITLILILL